MYMATQAIEKPLSIRHINSLNLDSIGFSWSSAMEAKARLGARLRGILTEHPHVREFSIQNIIDALQTEATPSVLAMFSAAGVFEVPDAASVSGRMIAGIGAGLALGRRSITLPQRLLRRKIPRNSLSILIQGIVSVMDTAGSKVRQRWSWVFHPGMSVALGVMLFLLGIVSMAPVIGGGIQHAASAFMIGVGLAERDGLTVMIGAIAGMASIAYAIYSVITGHKLWCRVKSWLVRCVRRLHFNFVAGMLDRICDGIGDLMRIRWGGLLLVLVTPGEPCDAQLQRAGQIGGRLKQRVQLALGDTAAGTGRIEYAC
jgi:hypothetical protein